jgi:IS5 family transposase
MLKVLLLAQWYGLSDPAVEEEVGDRTSFRRFCGLSLHDAVPDHSTIKRFRDALGAEGLDRKVFDAVNAQLDKKGLFLRKGTMVDASLIASSVNPPPKPKEPQPPGADGREPSKLVRSEQDPDAAWTRKGGKYFFGYKIHVGVDQGSGLIRRALMTDASVNDTVPADELYCGDEKAVYADAAYHTHKRQADLETAGIYAHLMRRANKHHPLSPEEEILNRAIGRVRGSVEQVFARTKTTYRWARARCIGLVRNTTHFLMMCTAMNLKRMVVLAT